MKHLIYILFIFLSACSPAKRIKKICRKNPDVCKQTTITKVVKDSLIIPQITVDTLFVFDQSTDTMYVTKENILIKYKYNPVTKKVYLSGTRLEQKHIFEHKIQLINNEVTVKKHWSEYLWLIISIVGGLLLIKSLIKK
jgi:hypothetical protein